MIFSPELDDAWRIRAMAWGVAGAAPVMVIAAGATLLIQPAGRGAAMRGSAGDDIPLYLLAFLFLSLVGHCRSGRAFAAIAGLLALTLGVACGALGLLLLATGSPFAHIHAELRFYAVLYPIVVALGARTFVRHSQRSGAK